MLRTVAAILTALAIALAVFLLCTILSGGGTTYGQTTGIPATGALFGTILGAVAGRAILDGGGGNG